MRVLGERKKLERLAHVAQRYYIEDWKQSDIAKELGVSRPLVSRMLTEARALGVVEISIRKPEEKGVVVLSRLLDLYCLKGGRLAQEGPDDQQTNQILCMETMALLEQLGAQRIGIGWGHFIGQLVNWSGATEQSWNGISNICPLMGNAGIPIRNYHSNENVRLLSDKLSATPYFFNLPALAESMEEKELLCSTELYSQMVEQWGCMDTALVNIGNYPASPDFASGARYGMALQRERACGRFLAYYYNGDGKVIHSDHDFAIQAPVGVLRQCKHVVGLCSANTGVRALQGALRTGLFTHLVARQALVKELLEKER